MWQSSSLVTIPRTLPLWWMSKFGDIWKIFKKECQHHHHHYQGICRQHRFSLTLSCHPSQSVIVLCRSSRRYPVSTKSSACLVRLTQIACEMGGQWPHNNFYVGCSFQDLLKKTCSIPLFSSSLWDWRSVAPQQLIRGVLLPGFVEKSMQ